MESDSKDRSLKSVSDNTSGKYRTMDKGTDVNNFKITNLSSTHLTI